ncbi:hypothetical protein KAFR_0F01820 [Kazachstania africana CBS 2517]|uniref:Cell wall mannoprotein PIR1-like C-terminal domain-containing protein n=1 Tax=Kazachstania africana (strain ATCC 22294 / BCRC 22015 / CBS 2517 / CECT 1963 / NBRC 1671 / NRRL Y-8276) TaxID=1071382 RepID=H2AWM9_KAZAF|nr:hypothetical protein KAFR_0F01820 [Kazachstania africana CBS 2517]CCF58779.1 hypothetical protein KAFR_0F01820 [Kazachstania africana CBS 2517]
MQYKKVLATAVISTTALSAYVPSEPWTTLTPTATYSGGITDYSSSFGIAVQPISTSTALAKRAKTTAEAVSQIGDGQIQATTATSTSKKTKTTAAAVSQIGDGQIQAATSTSSSSTKTKTTATAVSQIGDGQIQAATSTTQSKVSAAAVSQIGDGQIQASTLTSSSTSATKKDKSSSTSTSTSTSAATSESSSSSSDPVSAVSCKNNGTLAMTLDGSILTDEKGRIGSIVANRQFQFDGPPPQAGAIYAAGWSITPDGNLAIGDNDVFYECLSGDFYNLYDESIGSQCSPIHLEVVDLVDC